MIRVLRRLINGTPLRHEPVARLEDEPRGLRLELLNDGDALDLTGRHVPASLDPLQIAVLRPGSAPLNNGSALIVRRDAHTAVLGRTAARHAGVVELGGLSLDLFHLHGGVNMAAPRWLRAWRYSLAWWHTRRGARRAHNLRMSARDLRALDVYYMWARPVYLVTAGDATGANLFPMDLVGFVGTDGDFLFALRNTSPSVQVMRRTRHAVFSSVPAGWKDRLYALGVHHKEPLAELDALPFPVEPSPSFELPVPTDAFRVRELDIQDATVVGSHTLFAASVARDTVRGMEPQLAHVSGLFARCARREGWPI